MEIPYLNNVAYSIILSVSPGWHIICGPSYSNKSNLAICMANHIRCHLNLTNSTSLAITTVPTKIHFWETNGFTVPFRSPANLTTLLHSYVQNFPKEKHPKLIIIENWWDHGSQSYQLAKKLLPNTIFIVITKFGVSLPVELRHEAITIHFLQKENHKLDIWIPKQPFQPKNINILINNQVFQSITKTLPNLTAFIIVKQNIDQVYLRQFLVTR